jgi:hypothetical protein
LQLDQEGCVEGNAVMLSGGGLAQHQKPYLSSYRRPGTAYGATTRAQGFEKALWAGIPLS